MNERELQRQNLQKILDSQKTLAERNILGQYSTPYKLASLICKKIKSLTGNRIDSVLEPAIGTGVFYSALTEEIAVDKFVGYEIDEHYFNPSSLLWDKTNLQLYNQDFLSVQPNEKFSLIISNPPYTRHHHISSERKTKIYKLIKDSYGIEISGLSGLYVYFMILSTAWLKEGGYSCWLIPSEFLTVNYGESLKKFLLNNVDLISIHSFTADDIQFDDALVSSSIVIFRNTKPSDNKITFSWGSLENPKTEISINRSELNPEKKWNESFLCNKIKDIADNVNLGTFFFIKRGIATGDNNFFIVDKDTVSKYDMPKDIIISVAPPPRKLNTDIYTKEQAESEGLYLFSCSLPIETIREKYKGLYEYIILGLENEVNLRSNCRHRELWYKCETREKSPILVSYMGRDNGSSPIRFILNEANVTATNSYLMLYPKDEYKYLFRDPSLTRAVWKTLSEIPKNILMAYGRTYGGGLFKWEPKELAAVPCPSLKKILKTNSPSLFDT